MIPRKLFVKQWRVLGTRSVTGVDRKQLFVEDSSGDPIELFESSMVPEARASAMIGACRGQ
jgi:hypothetical protein